MSLEFLQQINDEVNAIPYVDKGSDVTQDKWIDTPTSGLVWECRDYSTRKAMLMRQRGFNHLDMGEVLCMTEIFADPSFPGKPPARYYHSVEFAKVDGAIYILDNRFPQVYEWNKPPADYQWVHQQIPGTLNWRDASKGLSV